MSEEEKRAAGWWNVIGGRWHPRERERGPVAQIVDTIPHVAWRDVFPSTKVIGMAEHIKVFNTTDNKDKDKDGGGSAGQSAGLPVAAGVEETKGAEAGELGDSADSGGFF